MSRRTSSSNRSASVPTSQASSASARLPSTSSRASSQSSRVFGPPRHRAMCRRQSLVFTCPPSVSRCIMPARCDTNRLIHGHRLAFPLHMPRLTQHLAGQHSRGGARRGGIVHAQVRRCRRSPRAPTRPFQFVGGVTRTKVAASRPNTLVTCPRPRTLKRRSCDVASNGTRLTERQMLSGLGEQHKGLESAQVAL